VLQEFPRGIREALEDDFDSRRHGMEFLDLPFATFRNLKTLKKMLVGIILVAIVIVMLGSRGVVGLQPPRDQPQLVA